MRKVGDRLSGRYELGEPIATGGMGVVLRARDLRLGREVAVKVLPAERIGNAIARERLLREARAAASLEHGGIVHVYDAGETDDGGAYLVMELVRGASLRHVLQAGDASPGALLGWIVDAARALAVAHRAGLVHRDVKPENVMVRDDGRVVLLDFGLAKSAAASSGATTQLTDEGVVVGTPAYLAPEQIENKAVDARADQFALAVTTYEALSGSLPWRGSSSAAILAEVLRDDPPPLSERKPSLPPELDAILARALSKSAADRYTDVDAFADALAEVLHGLGGAPKTVLPSLADTEMIETRRVPTSQRTRDAFVAEPPVWARRGRSAILGAIAVVAAAVAAIGVASRSAKGPVPAASATATATVAAPPSPRAVTEWPPPRTSSPEAATLYAEGLQAFRDAAGTTYRTRLERAVQLDPHFAAAHLRLALFAESNLAARQHLVAATAARAALDARDRRLLAYAEQDVRPTSGEAHQSAARELADALPDDPEALFYAAGGLFDFGGDWGASRAVLDRAIELDPRFAMVERSRALFAKATGDANGALAAVARCTAISPGAASCLQTSGEVHADRGQCRELEQDARRLVATDSDPWKAYGFLWVALAANGAAVETLQEVARKQEAAVDADRAPRVALQNAANLAVIRGDLAAAEVSLRALQRAEAVLSDETAHLSDWQLIYVYEEEGDRAKAAEVAQDYLRRLPAWSHDDAVWGREAALAALRRVGRVTDTEARSLRDAWGKESLPWFPDDVAGMRSIFARAWVETPAEAREAVSTMSPAGAAPSAIDLSNPWLAGIDGRALALAGEAERAIPLLRAGAARCGEVPLLNRPAMPIDSLMDQQHDRLELGLAFEQKGDRDGACQQYAAILARWGSARPRSVTADASRTRRKALSCAP